METIILDLLVRSLLCVMKWRAFRSGAFDRHTRFGDN